MLSTSFDVYSVVIIHVFWSFRKTKVFKALLHLY